MILEDSTPILRERNWTLKESIGSSLPLLNVRGIRMSQCASHSSEFYEEVSSTGIVWALKDEKGFPAPLNAGGTRSMPFWSSKTRVEKIIKTAAAYASFEPHSITLDDFLNDWIPGLKKDGLLIGVNWSGPKATGYDIAPDEVKASIQYYAGRPKM